MASARAGPSTLYVDGVAVGEGRVEQTEALLFSADETCDVGNEFGSPVTTDYGDDRRSPATCDWVADRRSAVDDHDHLITPEERFRIAMAFQ